MNEDTVRRMLDIPEKYGMIVAKVSSGYDVSLAADNIAKDLRRYRNVKEGREDFQVQSAQDVLKTF